MSTKVKVIISIVVIAASVAVGRFTLPAKIVEKEHIVYQDKIVEKIVYQKDETTKTRKVTIKFSKTLPDGTKTTETKIYYTNDIELNENQTIDKKEDITVDKTKEKTTTNSKNDWLISGAVEFNGSDLSYGLMVNRRILGPFYFGGFGFTTKEYKLSGGVSAGIAF
jgi:hypothetical protein